MVLLRLALDLRPDFTAARIVAADILENEQHFENALQMLAPVSADDPLSPVIRLQRAAHSRAVGPYRRGDAGTAARRARLSGQPAAGDARGRPAARQAALHRRQSPPMIAPSQRIKTPSRVRLAASITTGASATNASHQWSKAEADFKHALDIVARPAVRAELSRLLLGRHGPEPAEGPRR